MKQRAGSPPPRRVDDPDQPEVDELLLHRLVRRRPRVGRERPVRDRERPQRQVAESLDCREDRASALVGKVMGRRADREPDYVAGRELERDASNGVRCGVTTNVVRISAVAEFARDRAHTESHEASGNGRPCTR